MHVLLHSRNEEAVDPVVQRALVAHWKMTKKHILSTVSVCVCACHCVCVCMHACVCMHVCQYITMYMQPSVYRVSAECGVLFMWLTNLDSHIHVHVLMYTHEPVQIRDLSVVSALEKRYRQVSGMYMYVQVCTCS